MLKNPFKWLVLVIAIIIVIGAIFLINNNKEQTDSKLRIFENVNNQLDIDVEFTSGWRSPLVEPDEKMFKRPEAFSAKEFFYKIFCLIQ